MRITLLISDTVALVTGVLGLLLTYLLARASIGWLRYSELTNGALMGALAAVCFLFALMFLLPGLHAKALRWFYPLWKRMGFVILTFSWVAFLFASIFVVYNGGNLPFQEHIKGETLLYGLLGFLALFIIAFILPGLAFWQFKDTQPKRVVVDQNQRCERLGRQTSFLTIFTSVIWLCAFFSLGYFIKFGETYARYDFLKESYARIVPVAIAFFLISLPGTLSSRVVDTNGKVTKSRRKNVLVTIAAIPTSLVFAYGSQAIIWPNVYNGIFETEEAEITYVVTKKLQDRRCRSAVSLRHPEHERHSFRVCGLDSDFWNALEVNDTITVSGKLSRYGHTFSEIRATF